MLHKLSEYNNFYGIWEVTTEGDVEGRSTRSIGIYEGYIEEIAFYLADKAYYSLFFKRAEVIQVNPSFHKPTKSSVTIKTYGVSFDGKNVEDYMDYRNIHCVSSNDLSQFTLSLDKEKQIEMKKQEALKKLTTEEKAILGL